MPTPKSHKVVRKQGLIISLKVSVCFLDADTSLTFVLNILLDKLFCIIHAFFPSLKTFCETANHDIVRQRLSSSRNTTITFSVRSLAQTGLPSVGEAVPQALAVTPEQPVEDAVKEAVQVETFHVWLAPDPLQR